MSASYAVCAYDANAASDNKIVIAVFFIYVSYLLYPLELPLLLYPPPPLLLLLPPLNEGLLDELLL